MESEAPEPALAENPAALEEALGWVGDKLDDLTGSSAGRVEGVFVDSATRKPAWLVIRVGLLGRRSAVPFELAAAGVGHVWVPHRKETIRGAPEVDPAVGLGPAAETELCAHYGIAAGSGRMAACEGRDGEELTSVPA